MMRRLARAWRRAADAKDGVAAVEFALVVPGVILVYLVGFEVTEAATVYRKLSDTTVQLANTTAQFTSLSSVATTSGSTTTVTSGDVTNILNASAQIMSPYSTSNLTIVLSEVTVTGTNQTTGTVCWSQSLNGTALTAGSTVSMPSGYRTNGGAYILVQTTYAYQPVIGGAFIGAMNMSDQIYMLPRSSSAISYSVTNNGTTTVSAC